MGGVILVIVAALIVFFAVVGVIYGFILISFLLQRVIQRHYHVLQRKVLARDYVVQDLYGVDLSRYRAARAAGRPCPPPPRQDRRRHGAASAARGGPDRIRARSP